MQQSAECKAQGRHGRFQRASLDLTAGQAFRPGQHLWQLTLWCFIPLLIASCGGKSAGAPQTSAPLATASGRVSPTPSGPTASVEPRTGPPGTQVTVSGSGWPSGASVVITANVPASSSATPYATVTATSGGSFSARFLLEKTPSGGVLSVGRLDLVAESGSTIVRIQYQVQTPRPVPPTPGGG